MTRQSHLLEVKNLMTYFYSFTGVAKAVDDVSFVLDKEETLGIVGESGCGKSVTVNSVMRLIPEPPGKIVQGSIHFDGIDLMKLNMEQMRSIRGKRISMIFQEALTLNPVFTIGNQLSEMFRIHEKCSKREGWEHSIEMLKRVRIPDPEKIVYEYPHQLSGGMQQRVMIAMALSCNPEILIADEPTTALDVTIQAQILELMIQLKQDYNTGIIMITHDLGVIAEIAKRVMVMYAGKVVEEAETLSIFEDPKHPYTKGLLKSIPNLGERSRHGRRRLQEIPGIVPSLYDLSTSCSFYPRCSEAKAICQKGVSELKDIGNNHKVRCNLY